MKKFLFLIVSIVTITLGASINKVDVNGNVINLSPTSTSKPLNTLKPLNLVKKKPVKKNANILMDMNLNFMVKRVNVLKLTGGYSAATFVLRRDHRTYAILQCDIVFPKQPRKLSMKNQMMYEVELSVIQDVYDTLSTIGNDDVSWCFASKINTLTTYGLLRVK